MNNDLISREALKKAICPYDNTDYCQDIETILKIIDNAPTVNPEELKPLVDKIVEILPELTDAIIKELPKIVNGKIKCSECPYYTNTFDYIPRPQGKWIETNELIGEHLHNVLVCNQCGARAVDKLNFCPDCGARMKGGDTP